MANFPLDKERAFSCLHELEAEYLRVGTEKCRNLGDRTQLSAFLRLGIRSCSLLGTMLQHLLLPDALDAYDPVRRAFFESWELQFDFSFANSATKAQKWFRGDGDAWKADTQKLDRYIKGRVSRAPRFGREYGGLTELTHPTFKAATNSTSIVAMRRGLSANQAPLNQSLEDLLGDFAELLYRLIWLALLQDPQLPNTHIRQTNLKCCMSFCEEYMSFLGRENKQSMP